MLINKMDENNSNPYLLNFLNFAIETLYLQSAHPSREMTDDLCKKGFEGSSVHNPLLLNDLLQ